MMMKKVDKSILSMFILCKIQLLYKAIKINMKLLYKVKYLKNVFNVIYN